MSIRRWEASSPGRSRAVAYAALVWAVANPRDTSGGIREQTEECLGRLEETLTMAGSGRTGLLSVQIFLADLSLKSAMNDVWIEWIGPDPRRWPQRAVVGATLSDGMLIEIVAVAAGREAAGLVQEEAGTALSLRKSMATRKRSAKKSSSGKKSSAKKSGAKKSSSKKRSAAKRTVLEPHPGDKRYIRRDAKGRIKTSVDLGRSLSADSRSKSKTAAKRGQGDRGDTKR